MANITNVVLHLQHGGRGTNGTERRSASVDFTVRFSSTEILAGAVFRATAEIKSAESNGSLEPEPRRRTLEIGSIVMKAESGTITKQISSPFGLTRNNLDEDVDYHFEGPPRNRVLVVEEDEDEWIATVTLEPVQFSAAIPRNSDMVVGSWGSVGQD